MGHFKTKNMTWQEYEKFVFEQIKDSFPNAVCEFNSKVFGKYSRGERQCDVLVTQNIAGEKIKILVDAKYYSKKIDVKAVEDFISMCNDVDVSEGILVTPKGYSELAYNRAENDPSQIILDILSLEDLHHLQGYMAIPYSGEFGCLIQPAFGWIIDANQWFGNLAWSYRKGFDFNRAYKEKEFSYFNIWNTIEDPLTSKELFEQQVELLAETSTVIENTIETFNEGDKVLTTRKTIIENYLAPEYACAVEYDGFIFFGVLVSENNRETVNFKKLIKVIGQSLPINIDYAPHNTV
ncbi:restriction endonuclease [Prolixibacteraceae bacterium JC049]|nr:restriction endonuclease [Prolixibacteraceae bacterium JC049]